ncbi:signal peptidase I [Oceanirhabdus seepicola]|uniref:Signal peptidase I n=1 Tax=Oceanirhabdus seepicola TaxID=2828781 RepID=A0A9J6NZ79_9CLOT|nr:signal peptidase I [Oceanirhabdus seepicola]MCM1989839.1 signal peptidase I [Oceanirhabdus seepicola]
MKNKLLKLKDNKFIQDWIIPFVIVGTICLILKSFVFYNINVPTPSMVPTVEIGNKMFTTYIYNFDNLKRGDIIVFNNDDASYEKENSDKEYLKRLIGLPNEEIRIEKDGTVYVDGIKLEEYYVKYQVDSNDIDPLRKIGTFKVPEDAYFFLGDNRANSGDARYWRDPYVYKNELISKVRFRFWPLSKFGKVE